MSIIKNLSDGELMKLYRENREKDAQKAQSAFNEIFARYYKYLYELCCQRLNNSVEADILFERTWNRVYKYPSFSSKECSTQFATWLSGIAKHELSRIYDERMEDNVKPVDPSEDPSKDDEGTLFSKDVELMEEALKQLKTRDEEIVRTWLDYYTGDKKNMPSAVLDGLCSRYNTTRANIRKIKERSIDFLRKYVESRR